MSPVVALIAQTIAAAERGANPTGLTPKPWQTTAAEHLTTALHIDTWRTHRLTQLLNNWPTPTPPTPLDEQLELFEE